MKILHINSYYSTSSFYKNLFEIQRKSGLNIDVFVPISSNIKISDFDFGEYTCISRNHTKFDRLIFPLKHIKIYKDVQERYNIFDYTIIHAHSLFSNGYIAMKLKKKYGIPYIVAVRNTDVNVFFKKMFHLRKLGVEILKNANHIIFLSKSYEKQVLDNYVPKNLKDSIQKKISIIPNGIDNFWFEHTNTSIKKLKKNHFNLLQVGDINKNKNIETTVKAAEILIKKGYKVKLDVVGKVKDQNIFNKIKDLDFVNYLGYKPKEELIKIYRQNDIFILPSINETFGLVYAEAMSQGLPVIYSRGQGFDQQFEEGLVGYSVQCFDVNNISDKIISIIEDYDNFSNNCTQNIFKFNWKNITNQYLELYKI